jgi:hypothetical protein
VTGFRQCLVQAWGPYGAHPCPKTHLALCLSTSCFSLFFSPADSLTVKQLDLAWALVELTKPLGELLRQLVPLNHPQVSGTAL